MGTKSIEENPHGFKSCSKTDLSDPSSQIAEFIMFNYAELFDTTGKDYFAITGKRDLKGLYRAQWNISKNISNGKLCQIMGWFARDDIQRNYAKLKTAKRQEMIQNAIQAARVLGGTI